MATAKTSVNLKKAKLDFQDDGNIKVVEDAKEGYLIYDLRELLEDFKDKEGLNISISYDSTLEAEATEY